jgi:hypothetical protein
VAKDAIGGEGGHCPERNGKEVQHHINPIFPQTIGGAAWRNGRTQGLGVLPVTHTWPAPSSLHLILHDELMAFASGAKHSHTPTLRVEVVAAVLFASEA